MAGTEHGPRLPAGWPQRDPGEPVVISWTAWRLAVDAVLDCRVDVVGLAVEVSFDSTVPPRTELRAKLDRIDDTLRRVVTVLLDVPE